jgi:hypothetical protein
VLRQLAALHAAGFVHGDLLPKNVIFPPGDAGGFLVDFDFSRKQGESYSYVPNHEDYPEFRHPDARRGNTMDQSHDLHALEAILRLWQRAVSEIEPLLELFLNGGSLQDVIRLGGGRQ